jgi:imidazolonepropionase-like amidohydrolase
MSPAQILRSATVQPSQWLNNNAGEIESGRKANLVLLDKNPLLDIKNTKSINTVILRGRILDRTQLDNILTAVKQANNVSRQQDISQYTD